MKLLMPQLAFCILGLCFVLAAQAQTCRSLIASGNPQYPPYLWQSPRDEARLIGANAELMEWLADEIGVPIETRHIGNWARVQEEARAGRVDLIAGAFFTLPRTEYLDYAHPPFRDTRSVVIVREAKRITFKRWEDLVPLKGLTVVNNSLGQAFDKFAADSLSMTKVSNLEKGLQMLELGRGDYLVYEDSPAEAFIARMGIKGLRLLQPPVAQEQLYIAISHRSACNTPELRGAIARAMSKLRQTKLMLTFVERAVQTWRLQQQEPAKPQ